MSESRTVRCRCDDGEMDLHVWLPTVRLGPRPAADPGDLRRRSVHPGGGRAARGRRATWSARPTSSGGSLPGWAAGHDEAGLQASMEQVGKLDPGGGRRLRRRARSLAGNADDRHRRPRGDRVLPRRHAGLGCGGAGGAERVRQLLRVGCARRCSTCSTSVSARRCSTSAATTPTSRPRGSRRWRRDRRADPASSINVEHAGHAFDNHESDMFWNESAAARRPGRRRWRSSASTSRSSDPGPVSRTARGWPRGQNAVDRGTVSSRGARTRRASRPARAGCGR
jgi:hypothetical protein